MIGYLEGEVIADNLVKTRDGVGYLVSTPTPLSVGEQVQLYVTTSVREDDISLWGFKTVLDQQVFAAVTQVQGVGPSGGMSILRDLGVSGLAAAVESEDEKAFKPVRGVGPSIAKRIIASVKLPEGAVSSARGVSREEKVKAVRSLKALGYPGERVGEIVETLAAEDPETDGTQLIKDATVRIAKEG